MSLNILKDNALDIDISLIKAVREMDGSLTKKIAEIAPIDLSAIVSLSLVDSLINHGLKGTVTINNKSKILDKLKITSGNVSDLYLKLVITSKDLENTPAQNKIDCLCLVKNTTSASSNIEDNIVEFEFEESVIAEMRYTSWESLILGNSQLASESNINIIELVDIFYEKTLLEESSVESITLPSIETEPGALSQAESFELAKLLNLPGVTFTVAESLRQFKDTKSEKPSIKIPYSDNHDMVNSDEDAKVFDIFKKLLKKTSIDRGSSNGETSDYQFPIFRFVNTSKGRRMRFAPLITERHREFIKEVESGANGVFGNDYPDVYLEKFNIGPLSQAKGLDDKNTSWHNTLESHDIVPPDTGMLKESRWVNSALIGVPKKDYNIGETAVKFVLYSDALEILATNILDITKCGLNLPLLPTAQLPQNMVYKKGNYPDAAKAMSNQALYKIISSFLLVNEQLHFSVRGKLYREPGYFIIVDSGEVVEETNPQQAIDKMKQVWFVSSVTHIIDNGEYTTELICNRYFGENTLETITEYSEQVGAEFKQSFEQRGELVKKALEAISL